MTSSRPQRPERRSHRVHVTPYHVQLEFHGDRHITRWRPLVQWLLAIAHLMIASALRRLRQVLTLIIIVMTYPVTS